MAEVIANGKRKARDMNGSQDEPDFKAKKGNDGRRRSSFIRGNFQTILFFPITETK